MFTISQREGYESGIRLWRIRCPRGRVIGYNIDLVEILDALRKDGETAAQLETPSGRIVVIIADSATAAGTDDAEAPSPP